MTLGTEHRASKSEVVLVSPSRACPRGAVMTVAFSARVASAKAWTDMV